MAISVQISSVSAAAAMGGAAPWILRFSFGKRNTGQPRYSVAPPKHASSRRSSKETTDFNRRGRGVETDEVTESVIGAALAVHRALGPGLLESTYDLCLTEELSTRGLGFERQHMLPVVYGDLVLTSAYRVDFLVEEQVIVEIKAVSAIDSVHMAQVLTYLKLSGCKVGLLINFNVVLLCDGIRRVALGFTDPRRPRRLNGRSPA